MSRRLQLLNTRSKPGFTLLELVVVVTIMIILAGSLMSGYATMTQTQRLNNGADKLVSLLHEARSLAISNNAIYHVHFHDGAPINTTGQWVGAVNPMTGRPVYDEQMIIISRYPATAEALSVNSAYKMAAGTPNTAAVLPITPAEAQRRYDQMMSQATFLEPTDPTGAEAIRTRAQQTYINSFTGLVYNNFRVEEIKLESGTAMGIQAPNGSSAPPDRVIFFYPDGTASESITFFVTDVIHHPANGRTPQNDFRDDRLNVATYAERNTARADAYRKQNPHIRMVQVLRGGMIKALKAEVLP